ncbi:hypothetical protein [Sphingopyxis indica]|uniref:Uncharacterized protein n=1 Tax=Sphingopyxis indica TaxID=436663 RepID=A0A239JAY9_9SPHN|nr:hypothetical protein [Sphingopyxis indica]SNT02782.1 hypothetical protein SAMN06295955_109156 [Sphingopyxis indica]
MSHYLKNRHRFLDWRFLACVAALSFPSVDANAKVSAPQTIWAKAGVSREQFGAEALECGLQGLALKIDNSEEVKTLARASEQLDALDTSARAALIQDNAPNAAARNAAEQQTVIAATRPDEQYARIKEKMFKVVRKCMLDHGYTKIVLTEDQRNEYSEIKGGAEARRSFIYELASNPHLLEAQREAAPR